MLDLTSRAAIIASVVITPRNMRDAQRLRGAGVVAQLLDEGEKLGAADTSYFIEVNANREEAAAVVDKVLELIEQDTATFSSRSRGALLAGTFARPTDLILAHVMRGKEIVASLLAQSEGLSHPFVDTLRQNSVEAAQIIDTVLDIIENGLSTYLLN